MQLNVLGKDKKTKELEELEQTKPHWFVLMPTDLIARVWQQIMNLSLIFTAFTVPIIVAFESANEGWLGVS